MPPRRPITPDDIRASLIGTTDAAALLGMQVTTAYQLIRRRNLVPVLTTGRTHFWLRSDIDALALAPRRPGPPRKANQEATS